MAAVKHVDPQPIVTNQPATVTKSAARALPKQEHFVRENPLFLANGHAGRRGAKLDLTH
jgi:hypothetical protein